MLFVVDIALKLAAVTNGSYRINRVCMDFKIIECFCSDF
jgi:hypothetical protein